MGVAAMTLWQVLYGTVQTVHTVLYIQHTFCISDRASRNTQDPYPTVE